MAADTVVSDMDMEVTDTMDTDMARSLLMLRLALDMVDMAMDTNMEVMTMDMALDTDVFKSSVSRVERISTIASKVRYFAPGRTLRIIFTSFPFIWKLN